MRQVFEDQENLSASEKKILEVVKDVGPLLHFY